jgi:peptide/nickel transport system substrate-binding protein
MSNDQKTNYFFNQFIAGKMTRREFTGRLAALGASAALIDSFVVSRALAATPKKGGKITVGTEGQQAQDSLDPTKFYSTSNLLMGFSVYDTLVNRGPDLRAVPWLAESWEASSDSKTWTFKLRKDVTWHDGKKFTADDVIYACGRHISEKSESPAKAYMSQIAEMKKDGDHTVIFTLTAGNADFPIVLSDTRVHITQNGFEDFASGMSPGTGPFKVKEFKPGVRYNFVRNDDYWGSDGPFVDEIEVLGIGDITARVNALISGDINVLLSLDPKAVGLLEKAPGVEVYKAKSGQFMNVAMMLDRAPTNDNNFRLAMKHGIDRQQVVDNVLKGYGSVGNDHPIPSIDPFYCDAIPQRTYDPDKANFYIKKAGLEKTPIDFYTSDVPASGSISATQIFQQSAAKAGINFNLIQPPADQYWSSVWIKKPICASGWDARPVPDLILSIAFKSGGSYNETKWENEKFDKILVEARSVQDTAKRKEMYCELQRMLHDDGGHITMAFVDYLDASRSEVKGITPHGSGPLGFYQMARTVWIDG